MSTNFKDLPAPAKSETLSEIASLLELFALHAIDTATILSNHGIEISSWYIQDREDLLSFTQKAKQYADKLRDIGWSIVFESASKNIQEK